MVARVLRQAVKYAKNNATKKVSGKDSRKTLNDAKKRGTTRTTETVNAPKFQQQKTPPKVEKISKTQVNKDFKELIKNTTTKKGGDVSKNSVINALRKMGTKGKTAAAILAGGAGLLAGSTMMGDKKPKESLAPESKTLEPKIPERRKGPSGPTMTSMSAPSTGPKPRNKDEKVDLKKRGPSRPSMTGFKKGGSVGGTSMGLNLADRKEFKKMAERDKPAVKRMLEEKPKRPPKGTIYSIDTLNKKVKRFKKGGNINGIAERGLTRAKHK
jgi:hypothetical protein